MIELKNFRHLLNKSLMEKTYAARSVKEASLALVKAKEYETDVVEAQKVIQELAEKIQNTAHEQIARVVSRCLESVFGKGKFGFKILFEQKRGKTEARPVFVENSHEMDPMDETPQGAVDVASFALQLTKLVLSRPPRRRLLVLDEPFSQLHGSEWRERIRQMVETLSKEMKVQFLIFSQDDTDLRIGKVIEL